jgi:hypothetical protein
MTRHVAWHFYRQLAREGYRFESLGFDHELVKGTVVYAVPRGHRQLALRAVLSIAFESVNAQHRPGGTHVDIHA